MVKPEHTVGRSVRIAVIENDPLMRELAERWLVAAGHHVTLMPAQYVGPAIDVDLVMVDPGNLDGAAERVRSLRALHHAAILLVSGRLRRSKGPQQRLAQQFGVDAALPKPYSRDELFAAIGAALVIDT